MGEESDTAQTGEKTRSVPTRARRRGSGRLYASAVALAAGWERNYQRTVIAADVLSSVLAMAVLFGVFATADRGWLPGHPALTAAATTALIVAAMVSCRAWHPAVLGQGADELRSQCRGLAAATLTACVVILATGAFDWRAWTLTAVPFCGLFAIPTRYVLRRLLHRMRAGDKCLLPVLAAGSEEAVRALIAQTRRAPYVGWRVEAACLDPLAGPVPADVDGVPVIAPIDELATQVARGGYRIVAVTPSGSWTPRRLQSLAWDLEDTDTEMVIAPGLMEMTGPRLHVTGVLGMPVLRVSRPRLTGAARVGKDVFDRLVTAGGLVLLAPVLAAVALLVKCQDGGPVFYRQQRAGRDGTVFRIWKFRTMVVGADRMRDGLREGNDAAGPLFKVRGDPRITRVGSWLRKHSLDELPQLFNVLAGSMSLVGPRPPLPEETRSYGDAARRRLLVKPGLTGLWQVSGRSDLSWEESVRLDLRYVEEWSLALDAVILWKTGRAVVAGRGAY